MDDVTIEFRPCQWPMSFELANSYWILKQDGINQIGFEPIKNNSTTETEEAVRQARSMLEFGDKNIQVTRNKFNNPIGENEENPIFGENGVVSVKVFSQNYFLEEINVEV